MLLGTTNDQLSIMNLKNKLLLAGLLLCAFCYTYAQNTLPNLDLETWTTSNSGLYEEPNFPWKTANPAVDFTGGAAVNPVEKVSNAHSGDFAAKMESATIFFTFTAGALWTGDFQLNLTDPANSAVFGVPYEGTPSNLRFYYQYFPVNSDSMGVYTILRKWNPTTNQQDTIAFAEVRSAETVDEYTLFDLELEYFIPDTQPDSIEIAFTSSAAGFLYMGEVGSRLLVDEVTLVNFVGITEVLTQEVKVSTIPNPATDRLRFELDKALPNSRLLIYDAMGRQITTLLFTATTHPLNVANWQSGTYYFLLKNENGNDISSGKFLIK